MITNGEVNVTRDSFVRPNDVNTYDPNDVISDSTTATTLLEFNANIPLNGAGYVTKVQFKCDDAAFLPQLRLWLFKDPAYAVAVDNAALDITFAGDEIGHIDIPVAEAVGTNCSMAIWSGTLAYKTKQQNATKIYGVLQFKSGAGTPKALANMSVELTLDCF